MDKRKKHVGSFVKWNLTESEECTQKGKYFMGRANSVISNFKYVYRKIVKTWIPINPCIDR